jgi:DHA2 family multidrug resistance protein-like MFS transporter
MLATARLLGQTAGAVTVGVAFHLAGVRVTPSLLFTASIAALVAAGISMLRLSVPPPGRVAVYKPILD